MTSPRVALVATVLDEIEGIDALLRSIDRQTRRADEVVFVDGGSSDGTYERLESWCCDREGAIVLRAGGTNIAEGRNLAIAHAEAAVIAVTDGGCVLDDDWLERLTAPFVDPEVDVSMGFYRADARTTFERLVDCLTLPDATEISPDRFMPSSRSVAFRREVWEHAGRYPEWLEVGEDMFFDLRLVETDARRVFVPSAVVRWRLRPSLTGFLRQYYRYANGDRIAGMYPRRHAIRFFAYAVSSLLLLRARYRPILGVLPILGAGWWLRRPYRRAWHRLGAKRFWLAVVALPVLEVLMDGAKMAGYLSGRRASRER